MELKLQAPKGGCYSQENQEWYDGGQFLPTTCLPKGAAKKAKKVAESGNIASLAVSGWSGGYAVEMRLVGASKTRAVFFGAADECNQFAQLTLDMAAKAYTAAGFVPHPTELTLA